MQDGEPRTWFNLTLSGAVGICASVVLITQAVALIFWSSFFLYFFFLAGAIAMLLLLSQAIRKRKISTISIYFVYIIIYMVWMFFMEIGLILYITFYYGEELCTTIAPPTVSSTFPTTPYRHCHWEISGADIAVYSVLTGTCLISLIVCAIQLRFTYLLIRYMRANREENNYSVSYSTPQQPPAPPRYEDYVQQGFAAAGAGPLPPKYSDIYREQPSGEVPRSDGATGEVRTGDVASLDPTHIPPPPSATVINLEPLAASNPIDTVLESSQPMSEIGLGAAPPQWNPFGVSVAASDNAGVAPMAGVSAYRIPVGKPATIPEIAQELVPEVALETGILMATPVVDTADTYADPFVVTLPPAYFVGEELPTTVSAVETYENVPVMSQPEFTFSTPLYSETPYAIDSDQVEHTETQQPPVDPPERSTSVQPVPVTSQPNFTFSTPLYSETPYVADAEMQHTESQLPAFEPSERSTFIQPLPVTSQPDFTFSTPLYSETPYTVDAEQVEHTETHLPPVEPPERSTAVQPLPEAAQQLSSTIPMYDEVGTMEEADPSNSVQSSSVKGADSLDGRYENLEFATPSSDSSTEHSGESTALPATEAGQNFANDTTSNANEYGTETGRNDQTNHL